MLFRTEQPLPSLERSRSEGGGYPRMFTRQDMTLANVNNYMKNKKIYAKTKCINEYRTTMMKYALKESISTVARDFKTDRKTVRK